MFKSLICLLKLTFGLSESQKYESQAGNRKEKNLWYN